GVKSPTVYSTAFLVHVGMHVSLLKSRRSVASSFSKSVAGHEERRGAPYVSIGRMYINFMALNVKRIFRSCWRMAVALDALKIADSICVCHFNFCSKTIPRYLIDCLT